MSWHPGMAGYHDRVWPHAAMTLLVGLSVAAPMPAAEAGERTPRPEIVIDARDGCVAPPEEMRRNHMNMLVHQRPVTVRQGVRGAEVSLRGCIECHASREDGSAIGTRRNFCQSCHDFVAVKLDCFDCHQARPGAGAPLATTRPSERGAR